MRAVWLRVCKTVGSAYVGSNPTPATTCENGPWPADARRFEPLYYGLSQSHCVPVSPAISGCPRTYSGQRPRS